MIAYFFFEDLNSSDKDVMATRLEQLKTKIGITTFNKYYSEIMKELRDNA